MSNSDNPFVGDRLIHRPGPGCEHGQACNPKKEPCHWACAEFWQQQERDGNNAVPPTGQIGVTPPIQEFPPAVLYLFGNQAPMQAVEFKYGNRYWHFYFRHGFGMPLALRGGQRLVFECLDNQLVVRAEMPSKDPDRAKGTIYFNDQKFEDVVGVNITTKPVYDSSKNRIIASHIKITATQYPPDEGKEPGGELAIKKAGAPQNMAQAEEDIRDYQAQIRELRAELYQRAAGAAQDMAERLALCEQECSQLKSQLRQAFQRIAAQSELLAKKAEKPSDDTLSVDRLIRFVNEERAACRKIVAELLAWTGAMDSADFRAALEDAIKAIDARGA